MNTAAETRLELTAEETVLVAELLENARTRLLLEIRRTDHRSYRDDLRNRLALIESLLGRVRT
jgi:hypothetical protein